MSDAYDLSRFVAAQDGVFQQACRELRRGRKESHWMWFIFPQMAGLGRSTTALHFGIGSLDEARAYLAHPVLGPRLTEATGLVLAHSCTPLRQIFGTPDDLKFCSSMTLFATAAGNHVANPFADALMLMCPGRDRRTLELLG